MELQSGIAEHRSTTRASFLDFSRKYTRIYPGHYAPVLMVENGERVVKPMRHQCRLAGKPAKYDTKHPDTHHARRDKRAPCAAALTGKTENVILEFKPRPMQEPPNEVAAID